MRTVTRTRIFWTASAASLALAAAISGCSSKSSGGNATPGEDAGNESDSETTSSSGSSSGTTSSGGSSGGSSSGSSGGASSSGSSSSGGSTDGGDAGCTPLTIYNFLTWCDVSVNGTMVPNTTVDGGAASPPAAGVDTVCVPPGTVSLAVSPFGADFELGPNPYISGTGISGTDVTDSGIQGTLAGDGGSGSTSNATIVVGSTPACVLICCPFSATAKPDAAGSGCNSAFNGYTAFTESCQ
jgi:hypothetical protein